MDKTRPTFLDGKNTRRILSTRLLTLVELFKWVLLKTRFVWIFCLIQNLTIMYKKYPNFYAEYPHWLVGVIPFYV